jgi:hypothetical protein
MLRCIIRGIGACSQSGIRKEVVDAFSLAGAHIVESIRKPVKPKLGPANIRAAGRSAYVYENPHLDYRRS